MINVEWYTKFVIKHRWVWKSRLAFEYMIVYRAGKSTRKITVLYHNHFLIVDSNWQFAASLPVCPAYCETWLAVPTVFDCPVLYGRLAVASVPYNAVKSNIQLYKLWRKSSDVSRLTLLNWRICLESKSYCSIPHARKPARLGDKAQRSQTESGKTAQKWKNKGQQPGWYLICVYVCM